MEIAVTQVVADRELMFSHLCQHRPNRMPKRMPAYAGNTDRGKGRLDLPLENSGKIQRLSPFVARRRENEIPMSVVTALLTPFQQCIFQRQMHWQHLGRRFRFCRLQMSASAPVVRVLNAEAHAVEVAVRPAQGAELASTCPQRSIQKHKQLVPEYEFREAKFQLLW